MLCLDLLYNPNISSAPLFCFLPPPQSSSLHNYQRFITVEVSIRTVRGPHASPTTNLDPLASLSSTLYQLKNLGTEDDIPSAALCVYKSGSAWPVRTGPEAQRIIREARGVHGHPIQPVWLELGQRVYKLLDEMGVRWTSIDPLAFAEAGKKSFSPLLLWIGVVPGSLQYKLANTAAEAVTKLISDAGFSGVEIGFRESIVTPSLAGPKMLSFDPFKDPISEFTKPFTPTLGLSIAPLNSPHYEGTGALTVGVLLLTCAHVARPPPDHCNPAPVNKTSNNPREYIIALGHSGYISALQSMMGAIGDLHHLNKDWQDILDRLGEAQEDESETTTQKREEHLNLAKKAWWKTEKINEFHTDVSKLWNLPNDRIIGEVVHFEPIAASVGPQKLPEDWALIALHENKFEWDKFKGNVVYIGGNLSSAEYGKIMFPTDDERTNYAYPKDGLLQVRGVIQLDDIYNPKHLDVNGEQCLLVVKNGLTTGTTIGRALGMESFTRVYKESKIEKTSIEFGVLSYGSTKGPFSAAGDSGSIVLDRNGDILGMLTGGAGTANRTDVTYVTPYAYLDKAIKKYFPDSSLYEAVA
ncbi:hypothetical protein C8R41DRAFT_892481 [Lentinula lateritia]|uniref:Trypsin-like serine protease n=1 Tax=Lentinula lateritia TaxID=40482 RepID=A0ABQ8W049_9AGAR|nr:hypothetical protein C8R41DRAFT_892481 [Lentinula lateritia]